MMRRLVSIALVLVLFLGVLPITAGAEVLGKEALDEAYYLEPGATIIQLAKEADLIDVNDYISEGTATVKNGYKVDYTREIEKLEGLEDAYLQTIRVGTEASITNEFEFKRNEEGKFVHPDSVITVLPTLQPNGEAALFAPTSSEADVFRYYTFDPNGRHNSNGNRFFIRPVFATDLEIKDATMVYDVSEILEDIREQADGKNYDIRLTLLDRGPSWLGRQDRINLFFGQRTEEFTSDVVVTDGYQSIMDSDGIIEIPLGDLKANGIFSFEFQITVPDLGANWNLPVVPIDWAEYNLSTELKGTYVNPNPPTYIFGDIEEVKEESSDIDYETRIIVDPSLPRGVRELRVAGEKGQTITTTLTTVILDEEGNPVINEEVTERTIKEPVTEVFAVGTGSDARRIYGEDRYETALEIAREYMDMYVEASSFILATGENYPDALVANSLSGLYKAPILLTETNSLNANVETFLAENPNMKTVIIMGGTGAISAEVEEALVDLGLNIDRIGGPTRFETATLTYERILSRNPEAANKVYIANGRNFPDALVVGGKSVTNQTPVLLVERDLIPSAVEEVFENYAPEDVTIIGGQGVVSNRIQDELDAERIFGVDRNATSVAMAKTYGNVNRAFVTRDDFYTDALVSGPLAAAYNAPILLNNNLEATPVVKEYLDSQDLIEVMIIGGNSALSQEALEELMQ